MQCSLALLGDTWQLPGCGCLGLRGRLGAQPPGLDGADEKQSRDHNGEPWVVGRRELALQRPHSTPMPPRRFKPRKGLPRHQPATKARPQRLGRAKTVASTSMCRPVWYPKRHCTENISTKEPNRSWMISCQDPSWSSRSRTAPTMPSTCQ